MSQCAGRRVSSVARALGEILDVPESHVHLKSRPKKDGTLAPRPTANSMCSRDLCNCCAGRSSIIAAGEGMRW